jgi:hypothetical protein
MPDFCIRTSSEEQAKTEALDIGGRIAGLRNLVIHHPSGQRDLYSVAGAHLLTIPPS